MADEVQCQAATMRHAAMLDQIYALPASEHHASTIDRNRQAHSSEHRLDMAWHIVWPFLLMGVVAALRRQVRERIEQIDSNIRVCILLNGERGRRVTHEYGEEAAPGRD